MGVKTGCELRVTGYESKVQSASYGMLSLSSLRLEPNALRLESRLRVKEQYFSDFSIFSSDKLVKSRKAPVVVIPAKAGIQ